MVLDELLSDYIDTAGQEPVMVLIHMQNNYARDAAIVNTQIELINACIAKRIRMYFVSQDVYFSGVRQIEEGVSNSKIYHQLLDVARRGRCYSVTQCTENVFADTDLEQSIKRAGREHIILAGAAADDCVMRTAIGDESERPVYGDRLAPDNFRRGAVQRGFKVHISPDLIVGDLGGWPHSADDVFCHRQWDVPDRPDRLNGPNRPGSRCCIIL